MSSLDTIHLQLKFVTINPVYIDSQKLLNEQMHFLQSATKLAVAIQHLDKGSFDQIILIIIGTYEIQLLLDVSKFYPKNLYPIFQNNTIQKVFFDCKHIITLLHEYIMKNKNMHNIKDVSLSYSLFTNKTTKYTLDNIIKSFYGKKPKIRKVSKEFMRVDSRKLPIPRKMLQYSASEIAYLLPINDIIDAYFVSNGLEDNIGRLSKSFELIKPISSRLLLLYNNFKVIHQFENKLDQLLALRLHTFRMEMAAKRKIPYFHILNNKIFNELIKHKPNTIEKLNSYLPPKYSERKKFPKKILFIIKETLREYNKFPLLYYYEVERYFNAFKTINTKYFDIANYRDFFLTVIGDSHYTAINYRISKLKYWRKQQAKAQNIQLELFLPTITLKKMCQAFPNTNKMSQLKGVGKEFWRMYNTEILFWLSQSEVRMYK